MEAANNSSSKSGWLFSAILIIIGLVGLYYLYKYLFASSKVSSYDLLKKSTSGNPSAKITVSSDDIAPLYEGGEFTISTWIYINNWSYRNNQYKSILTIGGRTTDTIRIYLGAFKPKLMVRLKYSDTDDTVSQSSLFTSPQMDSDMNESTDLCDLPEIELQRWVNITVAVNGRTVDVYTDGKLARSCVLPSLFKVDAGGYHATLLDYGGFGGLISNTMMYDTALGPDSVYKNYMAGPEPIRSIGDWFRSFFA
jgi:hypothetical protein